MFDVTLKPTGMSRFKNGVRRPAECVYRIDVEDTNEAARIAREHAQAEGFSGYAITKIKEIEK